MSILDLFDDPALVACPFGFYDMLRDNSPVMEVPDLGFLVTRYDLVQQVIRHPEIYSSAYTNGFGATGLSLNPRSPSVDAIMATGFPEGQKALLWADDPLHKRQRSLVGQAFGPRRVAQLEASIGRVADELIDAFAADGKVELLSQYAVPLPLIVISDALGVSRADLGRFDRWSRAIIRPVGQLVPEDEYTALAHQYIEFQHYFAAQFDDRHATPRDDLLSDLVRAELDGEEPLSRSELFDIIIQIIVAGNETSANAIVMGMHMLLQRPDVLEALQADPARCAAFTEEVLRLESPVQGLPRLTTVDTELDGVSIPVGSRVIVMFGAANRDEQEFRCPADVDLDRPNLRTHLAFSQGTHHCIGATLARAEIRIGIGRLLARLPGLRCIDPADVTYKPSLMLRGLDQLHLLFERSEP